VEAQRDSKVTQVNKLLTTLNETMVIRATPDTRNAFDDEADEDKQNPEATVKAMAHNMGVTYQAVTDGGKTSRYLEEKTNRQGTTEKATAVAWRKRSKRKNKANEYIGIHKPIRMEKNKKSISKYYDHTYILYGSTYTIYFIHSKNTIYYYITDQKRKRKNNKRVFINTLFKREEYNAKKNIRKINNNNNNKTKEPQKIATTTKITNNKNKKLQTPRKTSIASKYNRKEPKLNPKKLKKLGKTTQSPHQPKQ
jgi:hypothetical protein